MVEQSNEVKIGDYAINLIWDDTDADAVVLRNIILRVTDCIGEELSAKLNSITSTVRRNDMAAICFSTTSFNNNTDGQFKEDMKDINFRGFCLDDDEEMGPVIVMLLQDDYDYSKEHLGLDAFSHGVAMLFIEAMYQAVFSTKKRGAEKFAASLGSQVVDAVVQNVWYESIYDEDYNKALNSK